VSRSHKFNKSANGAVATCLVEFPLGGKPVIDLVTRNESALFSAKVRGLANELLSFCIQVRGHERSTFDPIAGDCLGEFVTSLTRSSACSVSGRTRRLILCGSWHVCPLDQADGQKNGCRLKNLFIPQLSRHVKSCGPSGIAP
jgi:hypothetical protein